MSNDIEEIVMVGNAYHGENAILQVKRSNDISDIGTFGNVDKEDVEALKKKGASKRKK